MRRKHAMPTQQALDRRARLLTLSGSLAASSPAQHKALAELDELLATTSLVDGVVDQMARELSIDRAPAPAIAPDRQARLPG